MVMSFAFHPAAARAQDAANLLPPDTTVVAGEAPRVVSGRVVRPDAQATDSQGVAGVSGIWVTLHRVGSDTAGAVDSARTRAGGAYTFRYRRRGRGDAIYFVSASYAGIAYFSLPLLSPRVVGDSAEITVYDTTSGPVPLHVRGRHVIVSSPNADGTHDIVEVYEIANDSAVTLISRDDAHPTWTATLPVGATQFAVGQSDISPRAVRDDSGRVVVVAPFAPGLKQLSFSYRLPAPSFPLHMALTNAATVLEVLAEDPRATVTGARLARVEPVSIEGRRFERYLARDVPANAVLAVDEPNAGGHSRQQHYVVVLALAVGLAMLGALGFVFARQRPGTRSVAASGAGKAASDPAQQIAREIAELDAGFEHHPAPSSETRAAYQQRRAALKQSLARVLDARRTQG